MPYSSRASSADAFEKVVDELLASPHYGEKWARHWLDVVRYADSHGFERDENKPFIWRYRDYVVNAFNNDKPYDEFVIEQMAGDLLPERDFYTQVATGFNRNHRINSEGGSIPDEWIVEYVADRVETMGTLFLGLTLTCSGDA